MSSDRSVNLDIIDLTDGDRYLQGGYHSYPWREWDLLRREAPVHWYERPGFEPFWAITRHEDIRWISVNPQLFSNTQALRVMKLESLEVIDRWQASEIAFYGGAADAPMDFLGMDPPEHMKHRRVFGGYLTPGRLAELEGHLEEMALQYVDEFVKLARDMDGPLDLGEALSARLPVATICELAGIAADRWDEVYEVTRHPGGGDPESWRPGETREEAARRNIEEWRGLTEELVDQSRHRPGLISTLLAADVGGRRPSPYEVASYFRLLMQGGNETTRTSLTLGIQALLEHPYEMQRLADNPSLVPTAVEEMIRWTSIVLQMVRTAMEDIELRGRRIRRGELVAMWYPSANRDDTVFEDPYTFDVARSPNTHVGFGHGEHFCLGANLARSELRAMLRALIVHLPNLELAGLTEWQEGHEEHITVPRRVPVRLKDSSSSVGKPNPSQ